LAVFAFIPVRGGSQSIPLKNIKLMAGRPLIWWTLSSCESCPEIEKVVVATDSDEIEQTVRSFQFKKTVIYRRLAENATATASTESVMLEYLEAHKVKSTDQMILVQATSPFTTAQDFSAALKQMKSEKSKSLLSGVVTKRFLWNWNSKPLNYDFKKRPRRQDYKGLFLENGAFYISKVSDILKSKNRLTAPITLFEMPEHTSFEIDEPDDWIICEQLLNKYRSQDLRSKKKMKLFLSDVDGVLTDAGMYYTENGDEIKKFNTYDGMAFQIMQKQGIKVGILTAEDRQLNRRRAEKLKLDYHFHGSKDKLSIVEKLLKELNITWDEFGYIGDDINDIEVLKKAGHAFCPKNARPEVKSIPGVQMLELSGGQGVIRLITDSLR